MAYLMIDSGVLENDSHGNLNNVYKWIDVCGLVYKKWGQC